MKVSFFGHKNSYNNENYHDKLISLFEELIKTYGNVEFYFGGMSDFDNYCSHLVYELKLKYGSIKSYFVTPYLREPYLSFINRKLFDDIIYPPIENTPLKFAILKRNQWIIENSDLVIFNINHTFGGTYKAYQYAKRKKVKICIINE
ncbi:MAG: hypothetical protein IKJ14_01815 [Clostridia bacterium]|nr:hypothetical protein [Clostridia bacterium]